MKYIARYKYLIVAFLLMVIGSYFLYSYGRVTLEFGPGETVYQFESQKLVGGTKFASTKKTSLNKLVKRGEYVLMAKNSGKNFFSVVSVKGFLGTSKISSKFVAEKSRQYVGYNPGPCAFYTGDTLYSQAYCGASTELTVHQPATKETTTYNQNIGTNYGVIMGAVHTKEGVIMFAKQPTTEDGASFSYIAYNVSNGVSAPIVSSHELTDLDRSLNFTFVSYKDGFLAHDSIAGNIFYYTDSASKAKKIEAPNLNDAGLSLAGTSSLNGGFMTVFSNRASKGDLIELNGYSDLSDKTVLRNQKRSDVKPSTKVVIYKDGGTKQLSFNEYFSSLVLCGTNKLCGVSEDSKREMTVYDISGKNTVKLYSIENVRDLRSIKSGLLLVRDNNVVAFDADSRSGYIEYSVGLGGYCGIYEEGDNYLVCVADSKSNSAMLLINRAVDATYKIDLVVADLLTLPQVKDVSAYKEKLFVTLDTGEDIYDESLRSFVFDKAKQKAALAVVTKKLNDLGLDLKAFELIPLPQ